MARVSPRREVVEVEKDLLFIWSRFKLRRGCTALAKGCCCGVGWTCFQGSWRSNGDQCRDEGSALSTMRSELVVSACGRSLVLRFEIFLTSLAHVRIRSYALH